MRILRSAGMIGALWGATALTAPALLAQETQAVTEGAIEAAIEPGAAEAGLFTEAELDEMFAPVALYPDSLLAQVLLSTTYPLDVMKADLFITKNKDKSQEELAALIATQAWPEPVKGLAAGFPDLIGRMVEHIDWTEMVGNALVAQTDDSLAALQRLRAQAKLNGYLEDNAAMNVEESEDGDITISTANPEVVYVPQYTETVYTTPAPATPVYVTDDDDWDDWLATGAIVWGGAILIDEIFDDDDWDNDWGDYWGGGNGDNVNIDWDGDINIDNGINIGNDINRPGDRPGIGEGGGLGGGVAGGIAGGVAGGIAGGALNRPSTLPAIDNGRLGEVSDDRLKGAKDGNFKPTDASRDAAREKIKTTRDSGRDVSTLPAATGKGDRVGKPSTRPATGEKPKLTSSEAKAKATAKKPAAAKPKVSKPKAKSTPTASRKTSTVKSKPSYKPSSGSRAKASSSRGKSSRGGRR